MVNDGNNFSKNPRKFHLTWTFLKSLLINEFAHELISATSAVSFLSKHDFTITN